MMNPPGQILGRSFSHELQVDVAAHEMSGPRHPQEDGERHVHGRSREGDEQFLTRLAGHAFQPGDAADRQERDLGGLHAVAARREDVAELRKAILQLAPK